MVIPSTDGPSTPAQDCTATPSAELESQPQDISEAPPSMQSPASALADLLLTLELSTPGVDKQPATQPAEPGQKHLTNGHAHSKVGPGKAPQHPERAKDGDVSVGLAYDPAMEDHTGPPGHMERPQRTAVLAKRLQDTGLAARCWKLPSRQVRACTIRDLARLHPQACTGGQKAPCMSDLAVSPPRQSLGMHVPAAGTSREGHACGLPNLAGVGRGAAARAHGGARALRDRAAARGRLCPWR